jgi:hypothetical protein
VTYYIRLPTHQIAWDQPCHPRKPKQSGHRNARISAYSINTLNGTMKSNQSSEQIMCKIDDQNKKWKSPKRATKDQELEPQDGIFLPHLSVQCKKCCKWRRLSEGTDPSELPGKWFCLINPATTAKLKLKTDRQAFASKVVYTAGNFRYRSAVQFL